MKYFFTILVLSFVFAFSQEDAFDIKIDSGVGGLKINRELKDIETFLLPLTKDKMWSNLYDEGMITNVYQVNMAKFPEKKYFGMTIERIEVQMQAHSDGEGEAQGEDIFEFMLFLKVPADYDKLINNAIKEMGPIRTYSIEESSIGSDEEIESPNWFTHTTILTIAGKKAIKIIGGKKYLWVNFKQGYGG